MKTAAAIADYFKSDEADTIEVGGRVLKFLPFGGVNRATRRRLARSSQAHV